MRAKKFTAAMVLAVIAAVGFAPLANAATRPTTAQKLQLQYLIEEEKLARDVYLYLAENVTTMKFANIAKSEQTHMDQIAVILKTYNYFNPTTTRAPGVFRDKTLQALYNTLIAQGSTDVAAAMQVGRDIENLDIKDLQVMLKSTMPADMKLALNNLLRGSINHLAAFSR
ncbi:MAG: DUF2202 domain-containing protein [Candidatus Planktophila sp.]|nr:DUF2202 domain-containing protein [Candidatus Planktophila sp.]